jgi:thiamine biosynthesis lipoprotein
MVTFRAMNTDVGVAAPGVAPDEERALARRVADVFEASERTYSRFRPDSELSGLNRASGPTTVSPGLFAVLRRARCYSRLTCGAFDPAVGGALVALGYDRTFAPGALDRSTRSATPRAASILDLVLDATTRSVHRPPALQIDLGGLVKGRTADLAAAFLPVPGYVDAGGDAVLRGDGPDGGGWLVDVEDPADATRTVVALRVRDRAVASSAANRRRWRLGAGEAHHLIDPRTMRSADTDLAQVTVVAESAELADVLAKTTFILGARAGRAFLARLPEVGAVLVRRDAMVELVGDLEVADA